MIIFIGTPMLVHWNLYDFSKPVISDSPSNVLKYEYRIGPNSRASRFYPCPRSNSRYRTAIRWTCHRNSRKSLFCSWIHSSARVVRYRYSRSHAILRSRSKNIGARCTCLDPVSRDAIHQTITNTSNTGKHTLYQETSLKALCLYTMYNVTV